MQNLLTVDDLMEIMGCSSYFVYRLTSQKRIPHLKIGGKVRFDAEEIQKWLDDQRVEEIE